MKFQLHKHLWNNLSNVMKYIDEFLSNEFFNKAINRNYFLWNLQDSIGKELVKSIDIYTLSYKMVIM